MNTPFNFDEITRVVSNLSAQSQQIGSTALNAANGIAEEQIAAAETALDYSVKALRLPEASEPTDFLANAVAQQQEFLEAMKESATRIFTIASDAGNKTYSIWSASARPTA